jgi:hypothetical protein
MYRIIEGKKKITRTVNKIKRGFSSETGLLPSWWYEFAFARDGLLQEF